MSLVLGPDDSIFDQNIEKFNKNTELAFFMRNFTNAAAAEDLSKSTKIYDVFLWTFFVDAVKICSC